MGVPQLAHPSKRYICGRDCLPLHPSYRIQFPVEHSRISDFELQFEI